MIESPVYLIIGLLLVIVTSIDFFYTTLSFNGAGAVSKRATNLFSRLFLTVNSHSSSRSFLRFSGLCQMLLSLGLWISMLWVGLWLMLISSSTSIVNSTTGEIGTLVNKFYYSGYVLSTLGIGNYIPNDPVWQIVTAVFSFSGFIFITTAISYILNLTSAVLHKRSLSLDISNLGETPEQIINNCYAKGTFKKLVQQASSFQSKINKHNQNHYAYPLSHYFFSTSRRESFAINLAILDQTLTILLHYRAKGTPLEKDLFPLRDAISKFLDMVEKSNVTQFDEPAKVSPDTDRIRKMSIPTNIDLRETKDSAIAKRKAKLDRFVKSCGWSWKDVYNASDKHH